MSYQHNGPGPINHQTIVRKLVTQMTCRPEDLDGRTNAVTYCLDAPGLIPTGEIRPWGPMFEDREQME